MWKPFRNATRARARGGILFDKFHVMPHLGEAFDKVRKSEYARLTGKDRRFIKGQKYTLLSHHDNLTLDGRSSLQAAPGGEQAPEHGLFAEGIVWSVVGLPARGVGAALFRELARALKWQRLEPYEKFARMIDGTGTASPPTANPRTKCRWVSWRV